MNDKSDIKLNIARQCGKELGWRIYSHPEKAWDEAAHLAKQRLGHIAESGNIIRAFAQEVDLCHQDNHIVKDELIFGFEAGLLSEDKSGMDMKIGLSC